MHYKSTVTKPFHSCPMSKKSNTKHSTSVLGDTKSNYQWSCHSIVQCLNRDVMVNATELTKHSIACIPIHSLFASTLFFSVLVSC